VSDRITGSFRGKTTASGKTAVVLLFLFLLFHQADKSLIAPLATPIMEELGIAEDLMGLTATAAILVGLVLLPIWGYLGDRLSRPHVIGAASGIWGVTTLLTAFAPNYPTFLLARASTGIDDDAYPAVRSLVADYFSPSRRARVFGILAASAPVGYLVAVVLATLLRGTLGWRRLYILTGSLGLLLSVVLVAKVKEVMRGYSDHEDVEASGAESVRVGAELEPVTNLNYRSENEHSADLGSQKSAKFSWSDLRWLAKRPTFWALAAQGFFGTFPWNVIAFWFFRYLEVDRGMTESQILVVMALAIVSMSAGNVVGGVLGDKAARRFVAGRIMLSIGAVFLGTALLWLTLRVPNDAFVFFALMTGLTAFVIPIPGPNVLATLMQITPANVRSTSAAVQSLMEGSGASLAPFLAGVIAVRYGLSMAIGSISISAWLICGMALGLALYTLRGDIRSSFERQAAQQLA
jgi:MFS family permease